MNATTGTRLRAVRWTAVVFVALGAVALSACSDDSNETGTRDGAISCDRDSDCPTDTLCEAGVCEAPPCADLWEPVCDVDGTTWPNLCEARYARAVIAHPGECGSHGTGGASGSSDAPPTGSLPTSDGPGPSGTPPSDPPPTGSLPTSDGPGPSGTPPSDPPGSGTSEPDCEPPNPQGCRETGCADGETCTLLLDVCVPSSCFCDEGGWICTEDCGGGVCVPSRACDGPNPAGCTQDGCDDDERCERDPDTCAPSFCGCDEETGSWVCSRDCGGGGVCVPDAPAGCGPNPAGCTQDGCPDGERCERDPDICAPSRCFCDADSGDWACTRDCGGGGTCVPDDVACRVDTDCALGAICDRGSCLEVACITLWDPVCGEDGRTYGNACFARIAHVGVAHPGECDDAGTPCDGPNPAGCSQMGCDEDEVCDRTGVDCAPSICGCDAETGTWTCTADCGGGGVCIPAADARCRVNTDCERGSLCLGGQCEQMACPMIYDPVCGVDGRTYGNACEAAVMHVEVAYPGPCRDDGSSTGCDSPNPAGCTQDGCDEGEVCDRSREVCAPSSCFCDAMTGAWACTRDCGGGGTCVPEPDPSASACLGPNPAGCIETGCLGREICVFDDDVCVPSSCGCDPDTGDWFCTDDCGGGVCRPISRGE